MPKAEAEAAKLRSDHTSGDLPVPVEEIASKLGVTIVVETLDRNVSGMLFRQGDHRAIGVNSAHAKVRQRFTIAHELGHLRLHPGKELILDHVRLNLRDDISSLGTDREEREANAFAAELLMPRAEVISEVRRVLDRGGTTDARFIADLGVLFDVSEQAMEFRLVNLGLWRQI
jgi:Zn-dependent peptidase ImmA (M78 family)